MQTSPAEIETIVRVVLQRLRAMGTAPAGSAKPSNQALVESQTPGALKLTHKLVTWEQLAGKLDSVSVVQVPSGAVVTPSVFDELRRQGIRLERVEPIDNQLSDARSNLLILAADNKLSGLKNAAQQQLLATGNLASEQQTVAIAQHLRSGGPGAIWCSSKPFAAMLAAASVGNPIRAIMLNKLNDLARALDEAAANLLILDDREWSPAALGNLARAWNRSLT